MQISPTSSSDWIELIYAAAEDSSRWDAFLAAFCERLHARLGTFSIQYSDRPEVSISRHLGGTEQDFVEYATKWAAQDPWMTRVLFGAYPIGRVVPSQEICPDEELEPTEFYQQWLKPRKMHYGGGVYLTNGANQKSILAINRPKTSGPLTSEELNFWQSLTPHLSRAVRMHGEREALRAERDTMKQYLDSGPVGVMLLTEQARVLVANSTALEIVAKSSQITIEEGRLRFANRAQGEEVLQQIERAGARIRLETLHPEQFQIDGLVLVVAPTHDKSTTRIASNMPNAALYLIDSKRTKSISPDVLIKLYSFTQAEANVAAKLVQGLSLEETAAALFVSENTVRTHLKRVFAKTGCNRQAELVALVGSLAGHIPSSQPM